MWKKVLIVFSCVVGIMFSLAAGASLASYQHLNSKITSGDVSDYITVARPVSNTPTTKQTGTDPYSGKAVNLVLIGSDSRDGTENESLGGGTVDGMRSDTTIIAHISEARNRVELISIPRDSIVDIPACKKSDGTVTEPKTNAQFNSAFSEGDDTVSAAACTISTIEQNTGIYIDGYAVVDFSGFKNMVDALGGVKFNVPYDMDSAKASLHVKKGEQILDGETALAYARARTFEVGGGDGSDLSRIERQQDLLKAFASQLISAKTLTNPSKALNVSDAVLSSLTVNEEMGSVTKLIGFMNSLKYLESENIHFYTVPNEPWSVDRNRVVWTDEAENYWSSLKNDTPVSVEKTQSGN